MWFLQPGITFEDLIIRMLVTLVVIFVSLPLHEFAHAWTAYKLGDDTAKNLGRLTINPLAHFSTLGAVCLLLFDFGWANPVPIDTRNFKHPKRDMAISVAAGPLSNLLIAIFGGLLLNFVPFFQVANLASWISIFIFYFISINVTLTVFNLIPLPPLDGFKLLSAFLPDEILFKYYKNLHFISWTILILMLLGVFSYPLDFLERFLYSFIIRITHIPLKF